MTIGILKAYRFNYSIINESEGVFVSNQPLCAVSLRAALNEVLEAEARINVNVGLEGITNITINSRNIVNE